MDLEKLAGSVDRALSEAHTAIREELAKEPYGLIESYPGQPGAWETAEAIGILRWEEEDRELLTAAVEALISAQSKIDGGFAPRPDIASERSYCESTSRVLLSLAPVCALAPDYEKLHEAVNRAAQWFFKNQDDEGGWGAYQGRAPRLFPTCFAIQALTAARRADVGVPSQRCSQAISKAARWIGEARNDDGGFGTRADEESNHASSCHAAWGLSAASAEIPAELREHVLTGLSEELPPTIGDEIDDPARKSGGQFELRILSSPLALIGAVSVRAGIHERRVTQLVRQLLDAREDGRWVMPASGRIVWPTYMHVAALRLWLAVHRSFAWAPTSDFSRLRAGAVEPTKPARRPLRDHAVDPPRGWQAKLEDLTPRECECLAAYARRHPYKRTAKEMGISYRTVENYKRDAFRKLGIPSNKRELAVAFAALGGLIPDHEQVLAEHTLPHESSP